MTIDTVTLNIVGTALGGIAREMAANLRHAAFSSIVREARDFAVAVCDAKGEVISQPDDTIPMMTLGISQAFLGLRERVDIAKLTPDDAILFNDPFTRGQHLQDVYLFTPIFHGERLVAFACSTAHHVDLGGGAPGLNPFAEEIYQEGLRLPAAVFSISRDWNGGFVESVVRANVRVPDIVVGDLNAQFAANHTATERVRELCDRYGADLLVAVMDQLKDYAEARLRDNIRAIPDGVYTATEPIDAASCGGVPAQVVAAVTVAGSDISVDFSGTSDQVTTNINCPIASAHSAVHAAVRGLLEESDIPFNEGCNRPITLTAPYGSLLNPRPPAAVRARLTPASRAFDAVIRALAQAVPERAVAPGFDTTTSAALSHIDRATGSYQVVVEIMGGGWGASAGHDGADGLDNPISNCQNAPIEALETDYDHFRLVEYSLVDGSGGDGEWRGGMGFRRVYAATRDGVQFAGYADRHAYTATGLFGGTPGAPGRFRVLRTDGTEEVLPTLTSVHLNEGDRIEVVTGGGGGYGDPAERR